MERKNIIYIIVLLLQAGVILYLMLRWRKKPVVEDAPVAPPDDPYRGQRRLALSVTPTQLKILIPETETVVYGVVMDCNLGDGIVTLAGYITGAANIYYSHGQSKTGGGKNPEVGEAAVDFVTTAQYYLYRAVNVSDTDLAPDGCVRFYLLTNKGLFAAQEQLLHITGGTSPWIILFDKGNEVINLMRNMGNGSLH